MFAAASTLRAVPHAHDAYIRAYIRSFRIYLVATRYKIQIYVQIHVLMSVLPIFVASKNVALLEKNRKNYVLESQNCVAHMLCSH